jgi:hypothetical protein
MSEHTPLPWCAKEGMIYAENGDGKTIATLNSPAVDADAEYIVRACNCHEELVEACKGLFEAMRESGKNLPIHLAPAWSKIWTALEKAGEPHA